MMTTVTIIINVIAVLITMASILTTRITAIDILLL